MNAKHISFEKTENHNFSIEKDGKTYQATIYLNEKGKFIDEMISLNGEELEFEGEDGEIREEITNYLGSNWDTLVNS